MSDVVGDYERRYSVGIDLLQLAEDRDHVRNAMTEIMINFGTLASFIKNSNYNIEEVKNATKEISSAIEAYTVGERESKGLLNKLIFWKYFQARSNMDKAVTVIKAKSPYLLGAVGSAKLELIQVERGAPREDKPSAEYIPFPHATDEVERAINNMWLLMGSNQQSGMIYNRFVEYQEAIRPKEFYSDLFKEAAKIEAQIFGGSEEQTLDENKKSVLRDHLRQAIRKTNVYKLRTGVPTE